jgi:RNA polymerase sigma factor for flagellar operon FliA
MMSAVKPPPGRIRRVTRDQRARSFPDAESLAKAWREFRRTGADAIRNRLIEHYLYLVRYNAERIGAKLPDEVDVDDLMSAGIFGLVDAIDAFDLERGVKFETYCAPRIRGAILDELRNMDWVPRLVRHRAHKLADATRTLEVELGRVPNEEELARRLNVTRPQFTKLMRDANAVSLVSLSRKYADPDSQRDVFEIDVLPDDGGCDPVMEAHKRDLRQLVKHGLSRAERLIVVLYYYEQMTMKQIGQTLDLSESRVSQMHSAILKRLRDQMHNPTAERELEVEAGIEGLKD